MIQLHQLSKWLHIKMILDLLIVGNALMLMVSCATKRHTKVRFQLLDHRTEHMVYAANLGSPENIAIVKPVVTEPHIPAVNLLTALVLALKTSSPPERITKCLLTAHLLVIKKLVELVMMQLV